MGLTEAGHVYVLREPFKMTVPSLEVSAMKPIEDDQKVVHRRQCQLLEHYCRLPHRKPRHRVCDWARRQMRMQNAQNELQRMVAPDALSAE